MTSLGLSSCKSTHPIIVTGTLGAPGTTPAQAVGLSRPCTDRATCLKPSFQGSTPHQDITRMPCNSGVDVKSVHICIRAHACAGRPLMRYSRCAQTLRRTCCTLACAASLCLRAQAASGMEDLMHGKRSKVTSTTDCGLEYPWPCTGRPRNFTQEVRPRQVSNALDCMVLHVHDWLMKRQRVLACWESRCC